MTDTACLAWKYKDKLPFEGGLTNHNNPISFYLMIRCRDEVIPGKTICLKCEEKKKKLGCTGPNLFWGLVTEPIRDFDDKVGKPGKKLKPRKNEMAFSPWFLEMVKLYGISPENLQKAQDTWLRAVSGLNDIPPLPDIEAMAPKKEKKEKKIKVKVVSKLATDTAAAPEPVAPPPVPVPVKKRIQKKSVVAVPPVALLSEEKAVEVDVEVINVIIKELNGTRYYVDTSKSKVYDIKTSKYVGKWDTATETLHTSLVDSDAE
jgi:hypothetical protein